LDEVKESIINAYEIKTGMKRERLSQLMDAETWMNANKAREYGFCDEIMFLPQSDQKHSPEAFVYSRRAVTNSLLTKLLARGLYNGPQIQAAPSPEPKQPVVPEPLPQPEPRIKAADLEKRLSLLK